MMLNTYGFPKDIAKAAILASENSNYINATDVIVDGGFCIKVFRYPEKLK